MRRDSYDRYRQDGVVTTADPRATAELHTAPIADGPAVAGAYEDESPQAVTYLESLLEGADPYEGFYE